MTLCWYWKHLDVKKGDSCSWVLTLQTLLDYYFCSNYYYVTENWSLNPSSHQKNCDANPNNAFIHCISYPLTTISIIFLYNRISIETKGAAFYSLNGHPIRKFLCNIHDGIICIPWHDLTLGIKTKCRNAVYYIIITPSCRYFVQGVLVRDTF